MGIEVDGANQKLILDSDGDTYIEGATDDTLKVYVSGAQDFTITANTLTAESGSTIAAQALTATTVTASGIVKTDDATEATSTTDGSLQTDGGLSVVKDVVFGDDVKLLSDASVIHFGANSEVTLTHSHDAGLNLKHTATADDKPVVLTLQTGETDIAQDDVIGAINFQAPDEGTGTDAILVAAGIEAVSEGDFSSSNNATKLSFKTGASEAASEKMSLSSAGLLTIADDLVIKDAGTIGSASDTDAIAIASDGDVTFSQKVGILNDHDLGVGLHIKSADSSASVGSAADELVIEGSGNSGMSILSGNSHIGGMYFADDGDADIGKLEYDHSDNSMRFTADATERMRIDSDGNALFNTTTASTATVAGVVLPSSQPSLLINNSTTTGGVSLILLRASESTADETKFEVTAAGNVKSRSNSYGSFSDERIKEQIADASSQWTDIKNVKVKNFKFKSESLSDENNPKMLGVVAQELEASNMNGLVEAEVLYTATDLEVINKDKNVGDIKSYKTVKYSILYMKAIKALQEAMAKIEALEARVTTLEG